jgi:hypothetical protein
VVEVDFERRIFLLEAVQSAREVGRLFPDRFDGEGDDGSRYEHGSLTKHQMKNSNIVFIPPNHSPSKN